MSRMAATLEAFFTDRLLRQQHASPATIRAYRDTYRLLLPFAQQRRQRAPQDLDWADLDEALVGAFLESLAVDRQNTPRTCNSRLAAIRALFRYAALHHPEHAALIQRVLAIPPQRFTGRLMAFLTADEVDALLAAPDLTRWEGRRDRALLLCAVQTGFRLAELIGLTGRDVVRGSGTHVRCVGKGRKERIVPLTSRTATVLRAWEEQDRPGGPDAPLFPTRTGRRLSPDAVERLVARHAQCAARHTPSLAGKHVTPHVLRHTCAMQLLLAGVDTSVIALWLGHADPRSTQAYIHADLTLKEQALALVTPPRRARGALPAPGPAVGVPPGPVIMPTLETARGPPRHGSLGLIGIIPRSG